MPEIGDWAWELNTVPTKRSCCKVRGLNPGPTNTSCARGTQNMQRSCTKNTDRARNIPCGMHQMDNGWWPDWLTMARSFKFFNHGKRSKTNVFIPRVCRTYTTLLMSLLKIYQVCVESYTTNVFSEDIPEVCRILHNSLNVCSENTPGACRNLRTFIFHRRQKCIILEVF